MGIDDGAIGGVSRVSIFSYPKSNPIPSGREVKTSTKNEEMSKSEGKNFGSLGNYQVRGKTRLARVTRKSRTKGPKQLCTGSVNENPVRRAQQRRTTASNRDDLTSGCLESHRGEKTDTCRKKHDRKQTPPIGLEYRKDRISRGIGRPFWAETT